MVMTKQRRRSDDGVDFLFNSREVQSRLAPYDYDTGAMQPWIGKDGRARITLTDRDTGVARNRIIGNANTAYTKDAWIRKMDEIVRASRTKLRIVDDLTAAGLTYTVPEGMGVTRLEEEVMQDFGEARWTMDGMAKARRDRPEVSIRYHPLPLLTADLSFSGRQLAISRNGRNRIPIDTTTIEQNTRKMMEKEERLFVGTETYTFAGDTIYGLLNHPQRLSATLTLPTAPGWTPAVFIDELLAGIQDLQDDEFPGPYGLYFSRAYGQYFNGDYADTYGGDTLMTRMEKVKGFSFMRQLDSLGTGFKVVIVQLTSDVIRVVNITPLRLLNWNTMGGLAEHWKLLMGRVPQLRTDAGNKIGLWNGIAA